MTAPALPIQTPGVVSAIDSYNNWLQARIGKVTSSDVWRVCKKLKDGSPSKERRNYMLRLIAEHLTGQPTEHYMSQPMQWGIETEPQARAAYEARMNEAVQADLGFVDHPRIPKAGCSPDGFVDRDGLIEIKCPETRTHLATLIGEPIEENYIYQMMWQMACTGRAYCDFWSFDSRLPLAAQVFRKRFERDQKLIDSMERDVIFFLQDMSQCLERIEEGGAHIPSEHV